MLEGEWVLADISVEGCRFHLSDDHHVRQSILERIGDLRVPGVLLDVVGSYLASHRGVAYNPFSTVHVSSSIPCRRRD